MSQSPTPLEERIDDVLTSVWSAVDAEDVAKKLIDIGVIMDAKAAILQAVEAEIQAAWVDELQTLLSEVPMPSLSYEQVEGRIAELQAKLTPTESKEEHENTDSL